MKNQMIRTHRQELEEKRQQVRGVYTKYGVSPEYEKVFDQLHQLNMSFMAAYYREINGLISNKSKTPYN